MSRLIIPRPSDVVFEHTNGTPCRESVSVAVSHYNYSDYIEECLSSIAAQEHRHLELIVVDDRSTDVGSVDQISDWMARNLERFDRVLLLRHTKNRGLAQARNTAFEHSRTDSVFVIDADNSIYPRAISRMFEYVQHRDYDAAYTQLEFFGSEQAIGWADVWDKDNFRSGNYVDAMALVSKKSWQQVGGYSHIEGGWEDYDFWCKFVDAGMKAIFLPEILCRYRVHSASMLRTETAKREQLLRTMLDARHPWLELT